MEVREVQLEAVSEEGNWCRQMEAQSSQVQVKSSPIQVKSSGSPPPSPPTTFRHSWLPESTFKRLSYGCLDCAVLYILA